MPHFTTNRQRCKGISYFFLSRIPSVGFDHVRQGFQFVEQTAELGDVLHVHHDLGVDIVVLGLDIDVFQVDGLADEQVGDVIDQPLSVIGLDRDGHGVDLFRLTPGNGNEPLRVPDTLNVGTVYLVNGASASDSDITDDVVTRSRVAAFPEVYPASPLKRSYRFLQINSGN